MKQTLAILALMDAIGLELAAIDGDLTEALTTLGPDMLGETLKLVSGAARTHTVDTYKAIINSLADSSDMEETA